MKTSFLDFEQPIADLEGKIEALRLAQDGSAVDLSDEIRRLQRKSEGLRKEIYGKLSAWQICQVARHPQRPYTLDYLRLIFTDFEELHGDRAFADDHAIVGGLARFHGSPRLHGVRGIDLGRHYGAPRRPLSPLPRRFPGRRKRV